MSEKDTTMLQVDAFSVLQAERDSELAIKRLVNDGYKERDARDAVEFAYKEIKVEIRKRGGVKMLGGLGLLVLFGVILVFTGRLYLVIVLFAALAFIWGFIQSVFALGYDYEDV